MTQPILLAFIFGGGFAYWYGWANGRRPFLIAGISALGLALCLIMVQGYLSLWSVPVLLLAGGLLLALKQVQQRVWQVGGWALYSALVLAAGTRTFPAVKSIPLLAAMEAGTLHTFRFPAERIMLFMLLPAMVLSPPAPPDHRFGRQPPWLTTAQVLITTLLMLVAVGIGNGSIRWELADESGLYLAYWMVNNLLFVCVPEECVFRGIVQTALIRGFSRGPTLRAAGPLGVLVAALLFGLAHFKGGAGFMLLAAIAGAGYGAAYYLTGGLHHAVLVHFAVNAVYHLVFTLPH